MQDNSIPASMPIDHDFQARWNAGKVAFWSRFGSLSTKLKEYDHAIAAFQHVLDINPSNVSAMTQAGAVFAKKECYPQAIKFLQRATDIDSSRGEAWAVLAHCYVMTDDLEKAHQAYQNALNHLSDPNDPNLWYGIGLLFDRYGCLQQALDAFRFSLSVAPDFERADEVRFCIGIICKEQNNLDEALDYFKMVIDIADPPPPLTRADGWYQIGHTSELKSDIPTAIDMYRKALNENPKHPKTLQNLAWLEYDQNQNPMEAIRLLKLCTESDSKDGYTWYLLGRVLMEIRDFEQSYNAYQQAISSDRKNAIFWCSIGVLYYQLRQYNDAMDAYSQTIKLNPCLPEAWYDLGTLYESCNQNGDALVAYRRAAELSPDNSQIAARITVLELNQNTTDAQQQQQSHQGEQQQGQHATASQSIPSATQQVVLSQPLQMHPDRQLKQSNIISQLNPIAVGSRTLDPPPPLPQSPIPQTIMPEVPIIEPTLQSRGLSLPLTTPNDQNQQVQTHPVPNAPVNGSTSLQNGIVLPPPPPLPDSCFQKDGKSSLTSGRPHQSLASPQPNSNPSTNHLDPGTSQLVPTSTSGEHPNHDNVTKQSSPLTSLTQTAPLLHRNDHERQLSDEVEQRDSVHSDDPISSTKVQKPTAKSRRENEGMNGQEQGQGRSHRDSDHDQNRGRENLSSHAPGQRSHHSLTNHLENSRPQLHSHLQIQELPHRRGKSKKSHIDVVRDDCRHGEVYGPLNAVLKCPSRDVAHPDRCGSRQQTEASTQSRSPRSHRLKESIAGGQPHELVSRIGDDIPRGSHNASKISRGDLTSSLRENVGEDVNAGFSSRQHGICGLTEQPGSCKDYQRNASERHGIARHGNSHDEYRGVKDQKQRNVRSSQVQTTLPEQSQLGRLPRINAFSRSRDSNSSSAVLDEKETSHRRPQASTPSLVLSPPKARPVVPADKGNRAGPSSVRAPPKSRVTEPRASSSVLPLSGHYSGSLSRVDRDVKGLLVSGGISSGTGHGTSSLTKLIDKGIDHVPTTPNIPNPGSPSSSSSPLPIHGSGESASGHPRSRRLPEGIPHNFKASTSSASISNCAHHDKVPSPRSLPVLPTTLPRQSFSEEEKSGKDDRVGYEGVRNSETRCLDPGNIDDQKVKRKSGDGEQEKIPDSDLDNKPVFGVLRQEAYGNDNGGITEHVVVSKNSETNPEEPHLESTAPCKRELSAKDDSSRTLKRQKLLAKNESNSMNDGGMGRENEDDGLSKAEKLSKRGDIEIKTDIGSSHDAICRRGNGSPDGSASRHHRRDSVGRKSEGDVGKNSVTNQMIDLPLLSGNLGMPVNNDGSSRGSLSLALRSAPVTSATATKAVNSGSSDKANGDQSEYEGPSRMTGSPSKRMEGKSDIEEDLKEVKGKELA